MDTKFTPGAESRPHFYIESLGCSKNTVDSTGIATLLQYQGYLPTTEPELADVLIVNTCGFIATARAESLEVISQLSAARRPGQKIIAAGCWAQRDPDYLLELLPELDAVIGTRSWPALPALLELLQTRQERLIYTEDDHPTILPEAVGVPGYALNSEVSAFLKIADGCDRRCAFCAIPMIKGRNVSRSLEAIVADARQLQEQGVLEINLIAQDTTYYGYDLGMQDGLAILLEQLVTTLPELPWIRILYAYPGYLTPRLLAVMAAQPQILSYIDIPLQHAHPTILRRMRRPADMMEVRRTVAELRRLLPEVCLRTTFIVGFPGETAEEFETLLDFVTELQFDRVGVFKYSEEVGTPAADYPDDVPEQIKDERLAVLMLKQQAISLAKNQALVGKELPVLLEGTGDGFTIGRSYRDAPEVDGLVLLPGELPVNRIVPVRITEALVYDLKGVLVDAL
ncbi:MAG: 30S ribosomal protein S12 methylthiotransferase RimO [Chloroflexota bacterium]|nr:30S ribosomal protein S12 methylthiotransferase RimO [Chloroflexota bacterium]